MYLTRSSWLLAWGLSCLLCSLAIAEQPDYYYNYAPTVNYHSEEWFAPVDISPFGGGPARNVGYFGAYEYLHWAIGSPATTLIGLDVNRGGRNSSVKTPYEAELTDGSRYEAGWMGANNRGFIVGGFGINQNQDVWAGASNAGTTPTNPGFYPPPNGPGVAFADPFGFLTDSFGPPTDTIDTNNIITYHSLHARNELEIVSGEAMGIWRMGEPRPRVPFAPIWELMFGVRYINFNEEFNVWGDVHGALVPPNVAPFIGQDMNWFTEADNNLIGPQIALRMQTQAGPVKFTTEGRFFAAWNFQALRQHTESPPLWIEQDQWSVPASYVHKAYLEEFAPGGEFRINVAYLVTRKITVRAGWTAVYLTGLARPSDMVIYEFPRFGIAADRNSQEVFMHGLNMGVEVNR